MCNTTSSSKSLSELLFNVTNVSKHLQSEKCLIFLTNTNDDRCTLMNTNGLDSNNNINDETTIRKSITNSRSSSTTNATSKSMNTNHLSEMMNGNYSNINEFNSYVQNRVKNVLVTSIQNSNNG